MVYHLEAIKATFFFAKFALGFNSTSRWKGILIFFVGFFNLVFCVMGLIWSFLIEENFELKFFFGVIATGTIICLLIYMNNLLCLPRYENSLSFCESLHHNENLNACTKSKKCSNMFKVLILYVPKMFVAFYVVFP